MPYAIDLFCGAGGMSEGMIQAGFHILFSSDISKDAGITYVNRHEQLGYIQGENTFFTCSDIRDLDGNIIWDSIKELRIFKDKNEIPKRIDAIFGGPPCQGFSRAGQRKKDDPRNMLFKEYLRIVRDINPRYVVMENVEGFNDTCLLDFEGIDGRKYDGEYLVKELLLKEFGNLNYNVIEPEVLDASDYGVPQSRRRAIFIAYHEEETTPVYPKKTHEGKKKITVFDAISDLIKDENIKDSVFNELTPYQLESRRGRTKNIKTKQPIESEPYNTEISRHSDIIVERFSLFQEGEDSSNLRKRILRDGIDLSNKDALLKECINKLGVDRETLVECFINKKIDINMINALLTKKNIRTKLSRKMQANTVVTLPDDYISPFENRTFSVREMARLQSFDDSFVFLGKRTTGGARRKLEVPQYTQVGNAVPPLLARAIAEEIIIALNGGRDS